MAKSPKAQKGKRSNAPKRTATRKPTQQNNSASPQELRKQQRQSARQKSSEAVQVVEKAAIVQEVKKAREAPVVTKRTTDPREFTRLRIHPYVILKERYPQLHADMLSEGKLPPAFIEMKESFMYTDDFLDYLCNATGCSAQLWINLLSNWQNSVKATREIDEYIEDDESFGIEARDKKYYDVRPITAGAEAIMKYTPGGRTAFWMFVTIAYVGIWTVMEMFT